MATPVLEIRDLKTYIRQRKGLVRAVDGVSLRIDQGETVGLVGESGCGKSMTAMSIMKLLPNGGYIAGGSIKLDGQDLVPLDDDDMRKVRGNDVAVIFQDPMTSLNPTMTIGNQIAETLRIHRGWKSGQSMARAEEVLRVVGMPRPAERLHQFPHQLSGGLRQRVMIAMALACEPKLLIADEPTTALDVTIQAQILSLLDSLKREFKMAILLITHDLGVIAGRADRVAVMYAGKIVEEAGIEELFSTVRHPYTEALLQSIPKADQDQSQPLYSIPGIPPDLANPPAACRFNPRCRYATSECTTYEPMLDGDESAHVYACYHPVGGARPSRAFRDVAVAG
ncbi:MAG TPA: ABC transporter ATP-binding protein [Candidatus Dormibacteraeota bacterium]|nr:ABC transporter ATP-binding protein [Candidatus Dormibacteraeota bacterium]